METTEKGEEIILKQACNIRQGDIVINLGTVDKVETYGIKTKFDIIGSCLSCRFYWFDSNHLLYIVDKNNVLKSSP